MKKICLIIALTISIVSKAQVTQVSFRATGLTCSMCTNAIHKSIQTLDFVDDIQVDLKTYDFQLSFKPGIPVNFTLIKKKVESAGFSLTNFIVSLQLNNVPLNQEHAVTVDGNTLVFTDGTTGKLDGELRLRLMEKGFMSNKEFRKTKLKASATPSVFNVVILKS